MRKLSSYFGAIVLFMVVSPAISLTPAQSSGSPENYYAKGAALYEKGQYADALESFKAAILLKPGYADAHYYLGVTYDALEKRDEAVKSFQETIRLNPNHVDARIMLGVLHGQALRYQESVAELKKALLLDPNNENAKKNLVTTYYYMGESYLNQGESANAIDAFNEVIRLKPDDFDARIPLAIAYSDEKRFDEAIRTLKEAIRIQPDSDVAHFNLGLMYIDTRNKSAAMDEYRELQKLKSNLAAQLLERINKP